jgi:poly(3-hydroxybutyrate) depolymerase
MRIRLLFAVLVLASTTTCPASNTIPRKRTTGLSVPTLSRLAEKPGSPGLIVPGRIHDYMAVGTTRITYHVYYPTSINQAAPPPIVIAFSPSGNGLNMIKSLGASVKKANWIVIGCDKLRNSSDKSKPWTIMEDEALDDIYARIPHNHDRIYLAGFSGGAMRAYGLASRRPERFAGILAYAGWLGGPKYQKKKYCSHMAVAMVNGKKDKGPNAYQKGDMRALMLWDCRVKTFPFNGGHQMPSKGVTSAAIRWLELDWKNHGSTKRDLMGPRKAGDTPGTPKS